MTAVRPDSLPCRFRRPSGLSVLFLPGIPDEDDRRAMER